MTLESNILSTSYTATSLVAGTTYQFRIQARNIHGYSLNSEVVSILAAQIPDTPTAPVTIFNRESVRV